MSELQEVTTDDLEKKINPVENTMILSENEDNNDEEEQEDELNIDNDDAYNLDYERHSIDTDDDNQDEKEEVEQEGEKKTEKEGEKAEEKTASPQNIKIATQSHNDMVVSEDEDDSSSDEEDDDNDALQKLEQEINKDVLLDYHPESTFSSYNEVLAQCKIVRNKNGEVIDPLHTTLPFLTKYERARILGVRAKQLNNGADPFITLPNNVIEGSIIARMELEEKKIPFIIRRPMPNGGSEYWKVEDLEILEY